MISLSKISKRITLFLHVLLFFLYVYSFPIIANANNGLIGRITSTLVVIILVIILNRIKGKRIILNKRDYTSKNFFSIYQLVIIITVYNALVLLLFGFGNGTTFLGFLFNYWLIAPLSYFAFDGFFSDVENLFEVTLYATLIQCLIVIVAIYSTPFASLLSNFFTPRGQYDYMILRSGGYNVGFACVTSFGAMQISLGLVATVFFIITRRKKLFYFICFIIISFAMTAVARTGFFISTIGVIVIILFGNLKSKLKIISFLVILGLFVFAFLNSFIEAASFDSIFRRLIFLKEKGVYDAFFRQYFFDETTIIPPITIETIIGTGIVSGTSGAGVTINADGGFFRTYAACGLPLTVFSYIFIFYKMIAECKVMRNKSDKVIGVFLMICMVLGEFKEPFILFRIYYLVFFFIFSGLSEKATDSFHHHLVCTEVSQNEL